MLVVGRSIGYMIISQVECTGTKNEWLAVFLLCILDMFLPGYYYILMQYCLCSSFYEKKQW